MRSALRALGSVLIATGLLLLLDAVLTVTWQEPVSAVYNRFTQDRLAGDLRRLEIAPPTVVERRVLRTLRPRKRRLAFLARALRRRTDQGEAVGRVEIPKLGARYVVVLGTRAGDLRKGPGFYEQNPFPGAGGTTAIAGHRTTYAAPFRHVDRLRRGDRVIVRMPYGRFTYAVERTRIVAPTEVSVARRVGYERLVLSACHPLYSARQRIIVFARLRGVEARGAVAGR